MGLVELVNDDLCAAGLQLCTTRATGRDRQRQATVGAGGQHVQRRVADDHQARLCDRDAQARGTATMAGRDQLGALLAVAAEAAKGQHLVEAEGPQLERRPRADVAGADARCDATPGRGSAGELEGIGGLRQGFLEASNVDPVTELVSLIKTQRTFEMNSQVIQAANETLQNVSNIRTF